MITPREVILNQLKEIFKSETELDLWLSTPNKHFHNRTPADCLNGGDYSIFYDLLDQNLNLF